MVRRREDLKITCYPLSIYGWRLKGVDIPPTPNFHLPIPTKEEDIIEMLYLSAYKTNTHYYQKTKSITTRKNKKQHYLTYCGLNRISYYFNK